MLSRSKRRFFRRWQVSTIHTVGTSSTTFFQKVCQFVNLMASPKQPQSSTRFVVASTNVVTVKKAIISANSHAENTLKALQISITPTRNSAHISVTASTPASGCAHSKPMPKSSQFDI